MLLNLCGHQTLKASSCASLKPATKGLQEELKFTFDVSKCERIFD
jgi:hypothetical protein